MKKQATQLPDNIAKGQTWYFMQEEFDRNLPVRFIEGRI